MYRSSGEFHSTAVRVYEHFTQLDTVPSHQSISVTQPLSKLAFREAFFTLFGYKPSHTLISSVFPTPGDAADSGTAAIDLDAFLSFVTVVAKEDGCIAEAPSQYTAPWELPMPSTETSVGITWELFKSLAGEKDFIVWEDLLVAAATAAEESPSLPFSAQRRKPNQAVLSHVFSLLDKDHDGKLQLSDVRDYLS